MGKKHKHRHNRVVTPSFLSPVCPTCGRANELVEEAGDDDPMYECMRCKVRFMFEDCSSEQLGDDDAVDNAFVPESVGLKTKKKDTRVFSSEPKFGVVEELTDAVSN